ncbi:Tetratricopeptide TPR_2 repeat protein [Planctopirus limnophila DSM 3776]|uniref:Tetratricopeptide TPR_2 repeat protein n=1 Tax=Planctopirus limnophila (strain ATCC 43296 / DSM 3776 / IFAM 1008 / Mu 290) TaxID=521674 RepID=D5SYG0_PLAL2|nr:tetratricopeptide repeat protein [Planctopirus limnophila]ADG67688.1 Tetratricopeptide TPR_2 repeat protein [Planctopirus limnophila DSM 3776]
MSNPDAETAKGCRVLLKSQQRDHTASARTVCFLVMASLSAAFLGNGCTTTPGQAASSIWPTTSRSTDNDPVKLRDPVRMHVAYGQWNERSGNSKEARASYDEAIEKNPKSVDALLGLARLDILGGRHADAETLIAKAAKQAPQNAQVRATRGQLFESRGEWALAIEEYRAAVKLAPEETNHRFQLGTALAKSGDYEAGLAELTRVQGAAIAHYNVGYILHEKGERGAAERYFAKALQFNPELKPAGTILAQYREARGQISADALARMENPESGVRQVSGLVKPEDANRVTGDFKAESAVYRSESMAPPSNLTDAQREQWMNQQVQP